MMPVHCTYTQIAYGSKLGTFIKKLYTIEKTQKYIHVGAATPSLRPNLTCTALVDAELLYKAFQGIVYGKRSLEEDIVSDTSGNFQKILIFLLKVTPRDQTNTVNLNEAISMTSKIYSRFSFARRASESLIPIFCQSSYNQFRLIMQEFYKQNGKTLKNYIKGYFGGDYEKALISICIIPHTEGIQKNKINQVSRVVCKRWEIDLQSVLHVYLIIFKRRAQDQLKECFYSQCPSTVDALLILMGN
ncbi:hypothetical protein HZS_1252 [Henneguya salminicola]|nr:hypothetical protein HZS_1252 [Henneguya salminicola]